MSTNSKDISSVSVNSRLKSERGRIGGGQQKWADKLSVHKVTYLRWEKDTPIPSDKLSELAMLGFDVQYILTGTRCERKKVDKNTRTLSDEQKRLLDAWYHVPTRARALVMSLMEELIPHTVIPDDDFEILDPDRVHDMTPEELEAHRQKELQHLKSISPATKARRKRIKANQRKKSAHKEKEKV